MRKESTKYIKSIFLAVLTTMLLVSCGGGGGGGGMVSFSNNSELHNGGDAGGWGNGHQTSNNGLNGGSTNGSLSTNAGTFTPPNDIDWERIDLTITVTSGGTTTTHTLANTETEAIAELLTSLKRGDVVEVTADITMVDDDPRTTFSGAVTIGVGDNHISLPTPYKFSCSMEMTRNMYEDYGCSDTPSDASVSGIQTGIYTVNNASSVIPPDASGTGFIFDHWETVPDGQIYVPGSSRGDVVISPVFKPDYSVAYTDLVDTIVITEQNEFNTLMNTHAAENFSGKEIKLYCNISTSTMFSNTSTGFQGTFDGQGHTVSLNNITSVVSGGNYYAGLFAKNASGGTIQSVKVTGNVISSGNGGGCAGGIAAVNNGTVKMCANSANISGTGRENGGIVGTNNPSGTIYECYNTGSVRSDSGFEPMSGGITGWNYGAISDCYNTGTILGVSGCEKGGITGCYSAAGDAATVSNCYNTYSGSGNFGALCGYAASAIGVTGFYYDSNNLSCSYSGSIGGTQNPLTAANGLATADPSIWVAGSDGRPRLINNPE